MKIEDMHKQCFDDMWDEIMRLPEDVEDHLASLHSPIFRQIEVRLEWSVDLHTTNDLFRRVDL